MRRRSDSRGEPVGAKRGDGERRSIAGAEKVRQEHGTSGGVQHRRRDEHAREQHRVGGDGAEGELARDRGMRTACARERERDVRGRDQPAKQSGDEVAVPGPTTRRATYPRKLNPEKNSTSAHSSRGRMPPNGPYGPGRQQRKHHQRHHAEPHRRPQRHVVDARDHRMQSGFFDEQEASSAMMPLARRTIRVLQGRPRRGRPAPRLRSWRRRPGGLRRRRRRR